jgi:hypothetical protein
MQKTYNFFNVNWKLRSEYENWDLDSISIRDASWDYNGSLGQQKNDEMN